MNLNIEFPEQSTCTCPYAKGNRICKHMIGTYFSIFPDEADDFEREYLDEFDDEDIEDHSLSYPLCFDDILESYINRLSEKELKEILKFELYKDREYTFYKYLQDEYQMYLKNNHNEQTFIEELNQKIISLFNHIDYNYYNHSISILTHQQKEKISKLYDYNKTFANQ